MQTFTANNMKTISSFQDNAALRTVPDILYQPYPTSHSCSHTLAAIPYNTCNEDSTKTNQIFAGPRL